MSGSALNLGASHTYRYVLDAVPVACWIHCGGVIQYANPAVARLLGAAGPAALVGRHVLELLPPEARNEFELRVSRLVSGLDVPPSEQELTLVEGGTVAVEVVSTCVSFDGLPAVLSFFHDITAQRRAEAALRSSEVRYRRLVEGEIIGVFEFTAGGIQEANAVFLHLVGRDPREFPGGAVPWGLISPPEDHELDARKVAQLVATGDCKPFEKEFVRPDGSRVPVLMGAWLVAREPEWRAVALIIDLTDRRKLQEIQDEKRRLESIGMLAGGMAHNLNNILTGVIGNASLLLEHRLVPAGSRGAAVVHEIVNAGQRAATLTAQLLAYSGRGRFFVTRVAIDALIADEIRRLRAQLPENMRLSLEIANHLPPLLADMDQVRHVLVALVENAVEAIGGREGGAITIGARVEPLGEGAVLSRLGEPLPPGDYCVLEVRDNGAGMDNNTLAHAFDPFFSTKFPGRGLGLAAVAGIVRAAGGAIRVSSSPGLGSAFQVYLPAGSAAPD